MEELLYELLDKYNELGKLLDTDVWSVLNKHNMVSDQKYNELLTRLRACNINVYNSYGFSNNRINSGIKKYFREIDDYSLLSLVEEKNLFEEYYDNNISDKKKKLIKDKIIGSNLRLVIKIAEEFTYTNIPFEDLIQEGNMGLLTAFNKYDIESNNKFSTYAYYWIKQSIFRYVNSKSRFIRIPENIIYKQRKVMEEYVSFIEENGMEPTLLELSVALNMSKDQLEQVLSYLFSFVTISDDEYTYEQSDSIDNSCDIMNNINSLPKEESLILMLKYYVGCTFREIGELTHQTGSGACMKSKKAVLHLSEK